MPRDNDETETAEATPSNAISALCDGCGRPLDSNDVAAGMYWEMKPSSSGKGQYKQVIGPHVTHPEHWPPYGGNTHKPYPEWRGKLDHLPPTYRRR